MEQCQQAQHLVDVESVVMGEELGHDVGSVGSPCVCVCVCVFTASA